MQIAALQELFVVHIGHQAAEVQPLAAGKVAQFVQDVLFPAALIARCAVAVSPHVSAGHDHL